MNTSTIIKKLFATFPNGNATPATVLVYVERLASIPENELEAVVNQCIDESEFLPTIAKLKEMHLRMRSGAAPDKAAEGWLSVTRAMRDPDFYSPSIDETRSPRFRDPIVARVVEAMGWNNLRMSTNQMADRAQFLKFYESFSRNEISEQRLTSEFKALRDQRQSTVELEVKQEQSNGIVKRISG